VPNRSESSLDLKLHSQVPVGNVDPPTDAAFAVTGHQFPGEGLLRTDLRSVIDRVSIGYAQKPRGPLDCIAVGSHGIKVVHVIVLITAEFAYDADVGYSVMVEIELVTVLRSNVVVGLRVDDLSFGWVC
jgi:hypothetical protein